jgi:HAE1 family hydrophobic/amphiphilic exporter-1
VQELVAKPLEKLVEIPGIGEKTAEKLIGVAREYLAAHPPAPAEAPSVELEFTPEMEPAPEPAPRAADSGVEATTPAVSDPVAADPVAADPVPANPVPADPIPAHPAPPASDDATVTAPDVSNDGEARD